MDGEQLIRLQCCSAQSSNLQSWFAPWCRPAGHGASRSVRDGAVGRPESAVSMTAARSPPQSNPRHPH
jgi:hypothetical protein